MHDHLKGAMTGAIVGSTLGAPLRGRTEFHKLNYYEPIPVRMATNESLDAWLVWTAHIRLALPPWSLSRSMREHWTYKTQETAFGQANLERGLSAPVSGFFLNPISEGTQAFGRAAYWGIVFSGDPERAAEYAYYDASIDHASEGVSCAVALAFALANAAPGVLATRLVKRAMSALPLDSRALRLAKVALRSATAGDNAQAVRSSVLDADDQQDPYDAPLNLSYVLIGLLLGAGEFGATIRTVASMGGASDQTVMVAGALLGACTQIDQEWLDPLGKEYVGGHGLRGVDPPDTIEDFVNLIGSVAQSKPVCDPLGSPIEVSVAEPEVPDQNPIAASETLEATAAVAMVALEEVAATEDQKELPPQSEPITLPVDEFPNRVRGLMAASNSVSVFALAGTCASAEFINQPVAYPGKSSQIVLSFANEGDEELILEPSLEVPAGWSAAHKLASFRLRKGEVSTFPIVLQPPAPFPDARTANVRLRLNGSEAVLPFQTPERWYWVGPFENIEGTGFDKVYRAQDILDTKEVFNGRSNMPVKWTEGLYPGVQFDLEPVFKSGPGVVYLYGKLRFPTQGTYKIVCAASTGAIVFINRQKVIWYHDTHKPVPRAILPYVAEFDAGSEVEIMVKVLRNKLPLDPLVLYFMSDDGSIVSPVAFASMS